MSMSVGFRTIGSEANSETLRPSATVNFFTDSRAASGPTPAGLAANSVDADKIRGPRSNDILFILFQNQRVRAAKKRYHSPYRSFANRSATAILKPFNSSERACW